MRGPWTPACFFFGEAFGAHAVFRVMAVEDGLLVFGLAWWKERVDFDTSCGWF